MRGQGIIPARAGFTLLHGGVGLEEGDHPRSRGVYAGPRVPSQAMAGSSPLARGLLPPEAATMIRARIIPARAGFTCRRHGGGRDRPDHPRSRGVYDALGLRRRRLPGSSPLARGLRVTEGAVADCGGIIPARAGFTEGSTWVRTAPSGSSPLARGLLTVVHSGADDARIIPARAGFTEQAYRLLGLAGDHPRSRGVYNIASCPLVRRMGSSPLARGLRPTRARRVRWRRIIPARAGFTLKGDPKSVFLPDHPRSRGVYVHSASAKRPRQGSSPLARGLRRLRPAGRVRLRIIPARAGFTRRRR